jgi:hypothetical protein
LLFWSDRWLADDCLCDLSPNLFQQCTWKKLTVEMALDNMRWTRHLKANLSFAAITEAVLVWEKVQGTLSSSPFRNFSHLSPWGWTWLLFWSDRWLADDCLCDLSPNLFQQCTWKKLIVEMALDNMRWTRHLKANLSFAAITEAVLV